MEPLSPRAQDILKRVKTFLKDEIVPVEPLFEKQLRDSGDIWTIPPIMEQLKEKAKAAGLWNLFLPAESGLTQYEYAHLAEEMGRSPIGSEPFNCNPPDTGNIEVLHLYGTPAQKKKWLQPLLEGTIASCFCMTEPNVASSDATNMECTMIRDGNDYVINGRKWYISGAGDPRLKVAIVMGRTSQGSSAHQQHSMIIVPTDIPGFKLVRPLPALGSLGAPYGHFEIELNNVIVPASNILLGEGRGFEIAQGRLGPARIHHCMRFLGMAERALELTCQRAEQRVAFGRKLNRMQVVQHQIAESRIEIDMARLMVYKAARMHDTHGSKAARKEIAMIKIIVPRMACQVIDRAIQVHGGGGVSGDFPLAEYYSKARSLRIADGPDEVHLDTIAKLEIMEQFNKSYL